MAEAADSTPVSGGQFALTVADLNTAVNHEPRVSHKRLAQALGYADDRKLIQLAERHREALERFGVISATVAENTGKRGRPGRTLWFNKRQVLYLCAKSEMENGTEVTIQMVEVFDAHLAGRLAKPVAVAGHSRALPKPARKVRSEAAPVLPSIDRDGFAVMRIGGETLVVDMTRYQTGAADRAVRLHQDGSITVGRVDARSLGRVVPPRIAFATSPDPAARRTKFESLVRVVGVVVTSQPSERPGDAPERKVTPRRGRGTLARPSRSHVPLLPDLGRVEALGTA